VGEVLSEHTSPVELIEDRLRVAVSNLTWKRHLETMAPEILAKLNASLGRITIVFIEFLVDETVRRIRAGRPKRSEAETIGTMDEVWPELRESADAINNEALKEKFMLAAAECLERKERMKRTR